jgi:flagellar motility protein MotE (MotC chaperone)
MTDEEVVGILSQLGTRPAASLLASLPKERAAVLSQRLLAPEKR